MQTFDEILHRAEQRKGGKKALRMLLPKVATKTELLALGDDRYLSMMTKVINQAGFRWSVIEKKWPQFEEAFFQFNVRPKSLIQICRRLTEAAALIHVLFGNNGASLRVRLQICDDSRFAFSTFDFTGLARFEKSEAAVISPKFSNAFSLHFQSTRELFL